MENPLEAFIIEKFLVNTFPEILELNRNNECKLYDVPKYPLIVQLLEALNEAQICLGSTKTQRTSINALVDDANELVNNAIAQG